MSDQRYVLRTITVLPDGISIEYVDTANDMRRNGLQHNHMLFVPSGDDYEDEIDALMEAATALLKDGLEDLANTDPLDIPAEVDAAAQLLTDELDNDDD